METVLSGLCSNAWAPHGGLVCPCAGGLQSHGHLEKGRTGQLKECSHSDGRPFPANVLVREPVALTMASGLQEVSHVLSPVSLPPVSLGPKHPIGHFHTLPLVGIRGQ